jgi:hypothetical protein
MLSHSLLLGLVLCDGGRVAILGLRLYFCDGGRVAILGFGDGLGLGLSLDLGGAWSCLGDGLGLGLSLDLGGAWSCLGDGLGLGLSLGLSCDSNSLGLRLSCDSNSLSLDLGGAWSCLGDSLDLGGAWKSDGLGVIIFRRDRCCYVFGDGRWIAGLRLWFLSVVVSRQRVCCGKNAMTEADLVDRTRQRDKRFRGVNNWALPESDHHKLGII